MNYYYLAGPLTGFALFLSSVLSMEGVLIRKDPNNIRRLRLDNIYEYLKLPFNASKRQYAWGTFPNISIKSRIIILNQNWVFMVALGSLVSAITYCVNNYFFYLAALL